MPCCLAFSFVMRFQYLIQYILFVNVDYCLPMLFKQYFHFFVLYTMKETHDFWAVIFTIKFTVFPLLVQATHETHCEGTSQRH
jgi:hypothetical protein